MLALSRAAGEFQLVFSLLMSEPRALGGLATLEGVGEMHNQPSLPLLNFPNARRGMCFGLYIAAAPAPCCASAPGGRWWQPSRALVPMPWAQVCLRTPVEVGASTSLFPNAPYKPPCAAPGRPQGGRSVPCGGGTGDSAWRSGELCRVWAWRSTEIPAIHHGEERALG